MPTQILNALIKNKTVKNKNRVLCTRGLERYMPAQAMRRKQARDAVRDIVLGSSVQDNCDINDAPEELIAKLCESCTVQCREVAYATGLRDALAATSFQKSNNDRIRRLD